MPRVVYLVNFLAPDLIEICRQWKQRVDALDVLVSVPMEANRNWHPEHNDLRVTVQQTWTLTRTDRHPAGYQDVNYVHVPLDTYRQLRRLKPAVVVSAELGARSIIAAIYCRLHRNAKHIIAVSTSEHIEQSRDTRLRRSVRKWLVRRADAVTYHGESCRRYLAGLGAAEDRMSLWIYAADPSKPYRGELQDSPVTPGAIRLLTVGQLIERKGVGVALDQLVRWAKDHAECKVQWELVGSGPLENSLRGRSLPENLAVDFRGNCDSSQIQAAYRDHELMWFPTLGDEWGLVVDEAMHSGLVVIGSDKAQSCETLIQPLHSGYRYDPADERTLETALDDWAARSSEQRMQMRQAARLAVAQRTPQTSAEQIAALSRRIIL